MVRCPPVVRSRCDREDYERCNSRSIKSVVTPLAEEREATRRVAKTRCRSRNILRGLFQRSPPLSTLRPYFTTHENPCPTTFPTQHSPRRCPDSVDFPPLAARVVHAIYSPPSSYGSTHFPWNRDSIRRGSARLAGPEQPNFPHPVDRCVDRILMGERSKQRWPRQLHPPRSGRHFISRFGGA